MPLTLTPPGPPPVTIVEPVHRLAEHHDPNWVMVESVAARLQVPPRRRSRLPRHRRAVRLYLYSILRDEAALLRWSGYLLRPAPSIRDVGGAKPRRVSDELLYPIRLRREIARGREILDEARRQDPEFLGRALPGLAERLRGMEEEREREGDPGEEFPD